MSDFYELTAAEQCARLERLARAALPEWGIDRSAGIELIKHRENTIFKVVNAEAKTRHVLRVHRASYNTPNDVQSELQWMQALRRSGVLTPEVVMTQDGKLIKELKASNVPEVRTIDLFRWIDAQELGRIEDGANDDPETLGKYRVMGEAAARLHNHAATWPLPAGFTRHAWNGEGLLGEQPVWGRFWESGLLDSAQRRQMNAIRSKAASLLEEFGDTRDRYGLIHADLVPENLMMGANGVYIIDFDDMGFGWHLFDLATIMFWHYGTQHYDALYRSMIAGYRMQRELTDEMLEWFQLFLILRGTTYVGWCYTRQETQFAREMAAIVMERMMALLARHPTLR